MLILPFTSPLVIVRLVLAFLYMCWGFLIWGMGLAFAAAYGRRPGNASKPISGRPHWEPESRVPGLDIHCVAIYRNCIRAVTMRSKSPRAARRRIRARSMEDI
jgi:hypothetical protein